MPPRNQPRNLQVSAISAPRKIAATIAGAITAYGDCTLQAIGEKATHNLVEAVAFAGLFLKDATEIGCMLTRQPIEDATRKGVLITCSVFRLDP